VALVAETVQSKKSIDVILVPNAYQDWYFTTYFKTNLKKVYDLITKSATCSNVESSYIDKKII
jgi:cyclase